MNLEPAITYLQKLAKNNNREWFLENKPEFEIARGSYADFISALIERISEFDQTVFGVDAQKCLFRIYRDTRFSHDKTPYKTNFGAYIAPGGKKSDVAGYYLHLEPAQSFIAGGLYKPSTNSLLEVRTAIADNAKKFRSIVESRSFKQYFPDITATDRLKTAPRGFAKDHEAIEYLRLKNLIAVYKIDDKFVTAADFLDRSADIFKTMFDFIDFIRNAANDNDQ